jgi:putative endonuclease
MAGTYYVYILSSESRQLYVGVTSDIYKRLWQHQNGLDPDSYTSRLQVFRLVYCEITNDVLAAIRREKQIKGWSRRKKLELIDRANSDWRDLAEDI